MRILEKLNISPLLVYSKCLNSIRDIKKRHKFRSLKTTIGIEANNYDEKAENSELYSITPIDNIDGTLATEDMKKLYDEQLVKNKKGKKIYNKILSLAPLDRCPYCGIGQVSTLDHYLPKSKFPIFSVLPYNLVPSCKDCNTGKGTNFATEKEKQTLHPYYDNYTVEQWLYSEVLETSPVSVKFYVKVNPHWDDIQKGRAKAHFQDYKLAHRFSIEASNELANVIEKFLLYPMSKEEIQKELEIQYSIHKNIYLNSWQTALYQALSESDWYCGNVSLD